MAKLEKSFALSYEVGEERGDYIIKRFKARDIKISEKLSAVMVYSSVNSDKAVIYIHGFADFFHNIDLANKYKEHGYDFYGLDLRQHGRAVTDESSRYFIDRVDRYFEELDVVIYYLLGRYSEIIINGFSMGGLVASLYMHRGFYRDHIKALVLTSPLFKFSTNIFQDYLLKPVVLGLAALFPKIKYSVNSGKYKDYASRLGMGEEVDVDSVNFKDIPLYLGWLKAVHYATNEILEGLDIKRPILVLSSDKSQKSLKNYDKDADVILDVEDIRNRSKLIGRDVTYISIERAVHDIFFSREEVKKEAYDRLFDWLSING